MSHNLQVIVLINKKTSNLQIYQKLNRYLCQNRILIGINASVEIIKELMPTNDHEIRSFIILTEASIPTNIYRKRDICNCTVTCFFC